MTLDFGAVGGSRPEVRHEADKSISTSLDSIQPGLPI